MATANTIEARLRIAADLAQAITALRELRKEIVDTTRSADSVASVGTKAATAAAKADRNQAAKETTDAATAAARATTEQAQAEREAARAAREAARQRLNEERRGRAAPGAPARA